MFNLRRSELTQSLRLQSNALQLASDWFWSTRASFLNIDLLAVLWPFASYPWQLLHLWVKTCMGPESLQMLTSEDSQNHPLQVNFNLQALAYVSLNNAARCLLWSFSVLFHTNKLCIVVSPWQKLAPAVKREALFLLWPENAQHLFCLALSENTFRGLKHQCLQASSTQDAHAQRKQMGPVDVNGSIHTAHKQHQRKNGPICACASCVDWASKPLSALDPPPGQPNMGISMPFMQRILRIWKAGKTTPPGSCRSISRANRNWVHLEVNRLLHKFLPN